MTGFIRIIAALSGLSLFSFFAFVATAAYSAAKSQCPDGNDCQDATFAMYLSGSLAMIGLALMIPLCLSIWRGIGDR